VGFKTLFNSIVENMRSGRGFTLIELMVVILIISIMVAVAIPMLRRQACSAKWSEGKTLMGTITTAIRAHCSVSSPTVPENFWLDEPNNLGFARGDLTGAYFEDDDFSFNVTSMNPLEFSITATRSELLPQQYHLDQGGKWTP